MKGVYVEKFSLTMDSSETVPGDTAGEDVDDEGRV